MKLLAYDSDLYPFAPAIQECLEVSSLNFLHEDARANWDLFERTSDQQTPFHKLYYNSFAARIKPLWDKFVREVIAPQFEGDILYQTIPTFRVQIPNNVAVGEFHNDSKYGHQDGALNIFIPFVTVNEFNTIHVESAKGKEDFKPMLCQYGELVIWDGVNLTHGNLLNTSNESRVSMDARVVPVKDFVESDRHSINMNTPLVEGGYYTRLVK